MKAGFHEVGPADPSAVGGKPGTWYEVSPQDSGSYPISRTS